MLTCFDILPAPGGFEVDRPVLIETITDSEISPFPDHVLMKKSEKLASVVSKGDDAPLKNTGHILQQSRGVIGGGFKDEFGGHAKSY